VFNSYKHLLALAEQQTWEALGEGPRGLSGVGEPRRPQPSSASSGQHLDEPRQSPVRTCRYEVARVSRCCQIRQFSVALESPMMEA